MEKAKVLINKLLTKYALDMSFIHERRDYHPEHSLLQHTLTVLDNVLKYKDVNLMLAAMYHDVGKIATYKENGNSYGHERTSAWIIVEDAVYIERVGGNVELIQWLVLNHLKAGKIVEGRTHNSDYKLQTHKWWNKLYSLAIADDMTNDNNKELTHLIGKKIYLTVHENSGRNIYPQTLSGRCDFIGYNTILKRKQVTLNRTPYELTNYNLVCTFVHATNVKYNF